MLKCAAPTHIKVDWPEQKLPKNRQNILRCITLMCISLKNVCNVKGQKKTGNIQKLFCDREGGYYSKGELKN